MTSRFHEAFTKRNMSKQGNFNAKTEFESLGKIDLRVLRLSDWSDLKSDTDDFSNQSKDVRKQDFDVLMPRIHIDLNTLVIISKPEECS